MHLRLAIFMDNAKKRGAKITGAKKPAGCLALSVTALPAEFLPGSAGLKPTVESRWRYLGGTC
jgi:hypothetical protein